MPISPSLITNAEVVINGTVASAGSTTRAFASVYHYKRTNTVNPINKGHLVTAVQTQFRTLLMTCLSLRLTLTNYACRWLDDATDAYALTADTHPGLVTGDSMPLTNAAFILLQTGLRGKSYRGSKHLFPLGESATTVLTDDVFNAGALTYLGNYAAAIIANVTDSDGNVWQPCVLSRKLSQLKINPTTVTMNVITSALVNKRVGVMRHRHVKSTY
jgi:hypothetical protein